MNFSNALRASALRDPDRVALVLGDRRVTYAELDARADAVAAGLVRGGVSGGARVAVLMQNSIEFIEAYFGIIRMGACFVPVNTRLAPPEVRYCIEHSGAEVAFVDPSLHASLRATWGCVPALRTVVTTAPDAPEGWSTFERFLGGTSEQVTDVAADMGDVQRIMYTSGTTAAPKGVMITHGQVWLGALTRITEFGLRRDDVTLTVAPLFHIGSLDTYTTVMLYLGGTAVILPKFDPHDVLEALRQEKITCGWLAPAMLNMLFELPEAQNFGGDDLRVLLVGGEKTPMRLLERVRRSWPRVGLYDGYGLTECQGMATLLELRSMPERLGSVGRPMALREVRLVTWQGRIARAGEPGEIEIRGPLVTPGYYKDPAVTEATMKDGWLKTGDVAVADEDGFLTIFDRKKDMIRSGAENVASSEIERVLLLDEDIIEAAVVAQPDDKWGEVPVAFVVSRSGALAEERLRSICNERLARFKIPSTFVLVSELPRTPTGKVKKSELRASLVASISNEPAR